MLKVAFSHIFRLDFAVDAGLTASIGEKTPSRGGIPLIRCCGGGARLWGIPATMRSVNA